jgi:hypothetical protein
MKTFNKLRDFARGFSDSDMVDMLCKLYSRDVYTLNVKEKRAYQSHLWDIS